MLTVDKTDDDGNEHIHIRRPRRNIRGKWAKADLVAQCSVIDSRFFSHFPQKLSFPEMYVKVNSYAFLSFLPPYDSVQLCKVAIPVRNKNELQYIKTECENYKYYFTLLSDSMLLELWGI